MLIGYARISKADGSQSLDLLQRDALREAGVSDDAIYEDQASGQREDRPGLAAFLKAARQGDVIVVWRLDRLGRNLRHLVNLVQDLNDRDIGIRVLAGQGASIDTTTASGKLVFAPPYPMRSRDTLPISWIRKHVRLSTAFPKGLRTRSCGRYMPSNSDDTS